MRWLGFDWDALFYASDYFEKLYEFAVELIKKGKAYVDDLSADEIREYRGTLTSPGRNSPYRDRSVEENLDLFARDARRRVPGRRARAAGEDRHGVAQHQHARPGCTASGMPPITAPATRGASIRCTTSRTRFEDAIEGITHSLCTLEFEDHRPLYDWLSRRIGRSRSSSRG